MGNLTVVIPTLGGKELERTLGSLFGSSVTPDEVLICIPETQTLEAEIKNLGLHRILRTKERGQVAQRARGFQAAKGEWVMQLDDDVNLDQSCVASLLHYAESAKKNFALAPCFFDPLSKTTLHREKWQGFFQKANLFIMNGRRGCQPGKVTLSGHSFGPDISEQGADVEEVEWLSGGCVLHHRRNLITEDYFPFLGKAYCEDLIHSHHLRNLGVSLGICRQAKCYTEGAGNWETAGQLYGEYRARKYFQRLRSGSWIRLHLWYVAALMRLAMLKVTG